MMVEMTSRRTLVTTAAVLWIAGAAVYVATEAVAAAAFPGYSYATNYISDLGVPDVGTVGGRAIDSPRHAVMNTGFVVQGLLFLAAALTTLRATTGGPRRTFAGIAVTYAVGICLVGVVHGGQAEASTGSLHVVGAGMAIIGGNLAAITAAVAARRTGLPRLYAVASATLGTVGLIGLVMLQLDSATTSIDLLSAGTWERLAVYTVTGWQVLTGGLMLAARSSARARA